MTLLSLLQNNNILWIVTIALLSACVGSFLNVVIYRLPLMLHADWQRQCHELLKSPTHTVEQPTFNLASPRSHCPQCHHVISAQHNIPLLSYLLLYGKCAYCNHPINFQYFLIELICTLLSIFLAIHFGVSWKFLGALLFTWSLIPLIMIDFKEQLLPDEITLPLLWVGLCFNIFNCFTTLPNAVIGAIFGYLTLWIITYLYKLLTKKMAMGHGDFKLLASLGAWLGWQLLPLLIFIAALLGIIFGLSWLISTRQKTNTAIAFGPYLATTGWLLLIFHHNLINWYTLILR